MRRAAQAAAFWVQWGGAALALPLAVALTGEPRGDTVITGAVIYTLDPVRPRASALVIRGGRIAYVGDEAGARAAAGRDARIFALSGGMVLPGFHDSHIHPMSGGLRLIRCRLGDAKGAAQVYAAVRACAAAHPKDPWVLGSGWAPEALAPERASLAKLDELVPDRPAFLTTEDGFSAWINSRALAAAGIEARRGAPTGIVEDEAAKRIRRAIPPPGSDQYREALRRATAIANGFGITSLVDANATPAMLDAYRAADTAGELTVRVVAAQRVDAERGVEQVAEMAERRDRAKAGAFVPMAPNSFSTARSIAIPPPCSHLTPIYLASAAR
ncbi:MAG: amidohydrolase family protein [Alphaproteobacteria bacterium]